MNFSEIKKQLKAGSDRSYLLIGGSVRVGLLLLTGLLLAIPKTPVWTISSNIITQIAMIAALLLSIAVLAGYYLKRFELFCFYFSTIVLDVCGITVLVAFTGGLASPFVFLYAIELMSIFFLGNFQQGTLVTAIGAVLYFGMVFLTEIKQVITAPVFTPDTPISGNPVLLTCLIVLGLISIAYSIFLTALVRKRMDGLRVKIDRYQKILDESGVELMSSFHDLESVADRLKEQEIRYDSAHNRLMMADRYATLGWLSASIIHEFNNPLTSILTEIETFLLKKGAKITPTMQQTCKRVLDNASRIQTLVSNLTRAVRPEGENLYTIIDINRLIIRIVDLMKYEALKKEVEIETDLSTERPNIFAVDSQIEQMLLNLISNSLQAIDSEEGKIVIKTAVETNNLICSIEDNGIGITNKDMTFIFEPFFSSFPDQSSTGLGLFMVKEILDNHNGHIVVNSKPNKGTTVTIQLPMNPPKK